MELLVVLTIAAGMMALAPAGYRAAIPTVQLRHDTLELVAQLRDARDKAVLTQRPVSVPLEGRRAGVDITYEPAFGRKADPLFFAPDGTSTGGKLTLTADAGQRVIDINWLTGHIAVQP